MKEIVDNTDYATRNKIIAPYLYRPFNFVKDYKKFSKLPLAVVKQLTKLGFIELQDSQNGSPTNEEMLEFVKKHPRFTFHGYLITELRPDTRISFEGVECIGAYTKKTLTDFGQLFRDADNFVVENNKLYCWYD